MEILVTNIDWDFSEYDELDELDCPTFPSNSMRFFTELNFKGEAETRKWIYERLSDESGENALDFEYSIKE